MDTHLSFCVVNRVGRRHLHLNPEASRPDEPRETNFCHQKSPPPEQPNNDMRCSKGNSVPGSGSRRSLEVQEYKPDQLQLKSEQRLRT